MREIKFRVYKELTKEYLYLTLDEIIEYEYSEEDLRGEYTGLKDKNGKEIYEGAIAPNVDAEGRAYFVDWSDKLAGFLLRCAKLPEDNILPLSYDLAINLEFTGNIYENPELLKGGG